VIIDMAPTAPRAHSAKKAAPKKVASVKKEVKKSMAKKSIAPKSIVKKAVKTVPVKKAPVKKVVKKVAPAKATTPVKKAAVRSPNIVKPTLAKKAPAKKALDKKALDKKALDKKTLGKPFPAKLQSTTTGDSTTITVTPNEVNTGPEVVIEERRLVMPPPPRPMKSGKKSHALKPIKGAPAPLVVNEAEDPWTSAEIKAMRTELNKELMRLKSELSEAEGEMEDLISAAGVGAGDDQADAGTKTFEREHEMSLVYNARDMVLQTERAIERIDSKTYGRCEECGNAIGKARLQVFPRATLCMACKQKEERR
jgi:RNA polymerase-binding transcription factor DksA